MKTRTWAIWIAGVLIISAAAAFYIEQMRPPGNLAAIYQNGRLMQTVDLSDKSGPYDIILSGEGACVVRVEAGKIYILRSDCQDQRCVKQGPLGGLPVVCLPNKVIIRFLHQPDKGYDAMSGAIAID